MTDETPRLGWSVYAVGSDDPGAPPRRGGLVWSYADLLFDEQVAEAMGQPVEAPRARTYHTVTGTPKRIRFHTIIQADLDDSLTTPPNLRTISGMIRNLAEVIAWPGGQRRASPGPPKLALTDNERHLLEVALVLAGCLPNH